MLAATLLLLGTEWWKLHARGTRCACVGKVYACARVSGGAGEERQESWPERAREPELCVCVWPHMGGGANMSTRCHCH